MRREAGFTLIELLIVVAIIGIIAAIAIPSLVRARVSANEAAMIGDTRSVISAEFAYHSANSAFYGVISCLNQPSSCISGYRGPTFIDAVIASAPNTKQGYTRDFVPDMVGAAGLTGACNTFCYQGSPATSQGGVRSFGGDSSGAVYATSASGVSCCLAAGVVDSAACPALR